MPKVKVVTGYVPISNHPRTASDYGDLGDKLATVRTAPIKSFYNQVHQCWMHPFLEQQKFKVTHSEGDNPQKNTLAYHIVQHQKIEWMYAAAMLDPDPDVFIWMDYGIFHLPGVTKEIIEAFLTRVTADLSIPGCWNTGPVYDDFPSWRFCGSVLICPREQVHSLDAAIKNEARKLVMRTHNVSWEVNTWARVEARGKLPIKWYKADHNETIFSNYGAPDANAPV